MKNTAKDNAKGNFKVIAILVFIITAIGCIVMFINYFESSYDMSNYLGIFNISILVFLPIYYWICDKREKRITQKLEEKIFIKNIDFKYYRDILEEYSPTTLSFILDGLEIRKDFIASVIYLINKGYFYLTQDKKIIRTDKNCKDLPKDLQFLCNNVNDMLYIGTTRIGEYMQMSEKMQSKSCSLRNEWCKLVEQEAIEKGLVNERPLGKFGKISVILITTLILEAIYTFVIEKYGLLIFSIILANVIGIATVSASYENKWVKTQKGYDIYTKVVGLKNYIKDYSLLTEKEIEEITIWEDYLIYSIVLNNISKLNKKALEFYKNIYNIIQENNEIT